MRTRTDRKEPYTRRMLGTVLTVSVSMPRRIIRNSGPVPDQLYFDDRGNLVLITGIGELTDTNHGLFYAWRRVFTTRELSQRTYRGHWIQTLNVVRESG